MYITYALIYLNVFVFFLTLIFGEKLIYLLGFSPARFFSEPWTIITSMFVHGGFTHLFVNMLTLYFFGIPLERMIGKKRFLILYFLSGIFGNILYFLLYFGKNIVGVGASGAIFGVLGSFAILRPSDYVIMFPIIVPIPLSIALILWIVLNIFGMLFQIGNIGYVAHLGGLLVGIAFGKKLKREIYEYDIEEYINSFEF